MSARSVAFGRLLHRIEQGKLLPAQVSDEGAASSTYESDIGEINEPLGGCH
jgi:hypothetical protein